MGLPLSCCFIVKNEALFLEAAIESVVDWVDELLIFDTGSQDSSPQIAQSFKNKVPNFSYELMEWKDDFSWARNTTAQKARHPWVLFLDGDEVLEAQAPQILSPLLNQKEVACFSLIQRNYTLHPLEHSQLNSAPQLPGLKQKLDKIYYFENWMERLYRVDLGLKYEGCLHESLIPSCKKLNCRWEKIPLVLHHYGRLKPNVQEKLSTYLKLAYKKWEELPEQAVSWIELITLLLELEKYPQAFQLAQKSISLFAEEPELWKVAFQAALRMEKYKEAEHWIQIFLRFHPDDIYAQGQLTTAWLYQAKWKEAAELAYDILKKDSNHFVVHVNLGVICFEQKNWLNALHHIQKALALRPEDSFLKEAYKKITATLQKN